MVSSFFDFYNYLLYNILRAKQCQFCNKGGTRHEDHFASNPSGSNSYTNLSCCFAYQKIEQE